MTKELRRNLTARDHALLHQIASVLDAWKARTDSTADWFWFRVDKPYGRSLRPGRRVYIMVDRRRKGARKPPVFPS